MTPCLRGCVRRWYEMAGYPPRGILKAEIPGKRAQTDRNILGACNNVVI